MMEEENKRTRSKVTFATPLVTNVFVITTTDEQNKHGTWAYLCAIHLAMKQKLLKLVNSCKRILSLGSVQHAGRRQMHSASFQTTRQDV